MNRRDFLINLSRAGFAATLPVIPMAAKAETAKPDHFFLFVHASGGWDPTILCDPKGSADRSDQRGPVNRFTEQAIKSVNSGGIKYAPYPQSDEDLTAGITSDYDHFFEKYANDLLVINGINTQTNNHDTGTRKIWSGTDRLGSVATSAMIASVWADKLPLPFLSYGGYDQGGDIISPTRVSSTSILTNLAKPNETGRSGTDKNFFANAVYHKVQAARATRLSNLQSKTQLSKQKALLEELAAARVSENTLDVLIQKLPEDMSSGDKGKAEVIAAAFASGVSVCANLSRGGFDTHGNHDATAFPRMADLLNTVDHFMEQAKIHGIEDKVTVVMGSDFGRTPWYNSENGKDHWNVTSMMIMGKGVIGGRTLGGTDALYNAQNVNPMSFSAVSSGGSMLTPDYVNQAIRDLTVLKGQSFASLGVNATGLLS